jgi:hypothetical protein
MGEVVVGVKETVGERERKVFAKLLILLNNEEV